MTTSNTATVPPVVREIEYLSPPARVRMADSWFEIAPLDHFWVRRRFEVLQKMAGDLIEATGEMAEVGCGHGLLQRQIEDAYDRQVTGFDLNEIALKQNLSRRSRVCSYDIFQLDPSLKAHFDLILMFDVLEHIPEEDRFLQAALFHLKPGGKLVLNVPAGQWAFSAYDTANGHVRRYSISTLRQTAGRNHLEFQGWTYWGLPFVPPVFLRKFLLHGKHDQREIMTKGFDSRSRRMNAALGLLSKLEWIPQKLLGTSLLAVLQRGL